MRLIRGEALEEMDKLIAEGIIGIELDENYYNIAKDRIENAQQQITLHQL